MNKFLTFLTLSLLSFSTLIAQQKPNIVIIVSDDHSYQTYLLMDRK